MPSDLLHSFYTMDAYAVVTCSGDGGLSSCQTKVERNNMQPHWNERCSFPDAALGNSVLVALFDHNKLTSDVFLGQVGRPVALPGCMLDCSSWSRLEQGTSDALQGNLGFNGQLLLSSCICSQSADFGVRQDFERLCGSEQTLLLTSKHFTWARVRYAAAAVMLCWWQHAHL